MLLALVVLAVAVPAVRWTGGSPGPPLGLEELQGLHWRTELAAPERRGFLAADYAQVAAAAVGPDLVALATDAGIVALHAITGELAWEHRTVDPLQVLQGGLPAPAFGDLDAGPGVVAAGGAFGDRYVVLGADGEVIAETAAGPPGSAAAPAVAPDGDDVYAVEFGTIVQIDPGTGRRAEFAAIDTGSGRVVRGGLAVTERLVLAASGPVLSAFDRGSGEPNWSVRATAQPFLGRTPVTSSERVHVVDLAGTLHSFDLATGALVWQANGGSSITVEDLDILTVRDIAVTPDAVIAHMADGRLLGYDADSGELRWQAASTAERGYRTVVAAGEVVVAWDGRLHGLDARTGERRWTEDGGDQLLLAASHELVVAVQADGSVDALDPASGAPRWRYSAVGSAGPATFTEPVVVGDLVVTATLGGSVTATDAGTGETRWRFEPSDQEAVVARPAVTGGEVVVGTNRRLYGLDRRTGQEVWTVPVVTLAGSTPAASPDAIVVNVGSALVAVDGERRVAWQWRPRTRALVAPPTIADGVVYAAASDGSLAALDSAGGEPAWHLDVGPGVVGAVAVVGEVVVARTVGGDLLAVEAATGRARWRHDLAGSAVTAPLALDGAVIAAAGSSLLALEPGSGRERWRHEVGGGHLTTPSGDRGTAYVGTAGGSVVAMEATTGTERWRYVVGTPLVTPPTLGPDAVYVTTLDGELIALR